jgi:RNA polymerase sigma-70 factor (ECF subfamily)
MHAGPIIDVTAAAARGAAAGWGSSGPCAGIPPLADSPQALTVAEEREHVRRCADGDQVATGLLYDAYVARLYRYCLARVGNETDAEDLAEEIFIKALGAIGGFEWRDLGSSERSPFGAWLFRIAHNHVASHHRRAAVRGPSFEVPEWVPDEDRGPAELAETQLTIEEVFALVDQLPEAQREVIRLRFGAGLNVAETAEALDKRQSNVKVLQHKAVKRLRNLVAAQAASTSGTPAEAGGGREPSER